MAIPVGLGMPAAPPPVLAPRRKTRQLMVGDIGVGSDHRVGVQSMTTTKTADINATLQQIAELTASGCQIVRVAVPDTDDAEALPAIAKKSQIPVKHHDPVVMVRAYELLAEQTDYPLHLGVTEAGPAFQGTIKSAVAFGALLSQGIGDTIRVSLSAPPVEEVKAVPESQIVETLIEEAMRIAGEHTAADVPSGPPVVTVG